MVKNRLEFLIWINLGITKDKFNLKVFADVSPIWADEVGRNSISAFENNGYGYILTASYDQASFLCLAIFDLNIVDKSKTNLIDFNYYVHTDFKDSSKVNLIYKFNIRDFITFSISPIYFSNYKSQYNYHYLVASWYNNGLLFFKATNLINRKDQIHKDSWCEYGDYESPYHQFYQDNRKWNSLNYFQSKKRNGKGNSYSIFKLLSFVLLFLKSGLSLNPWIRIFKLKIKS